MKILFNDANLYRFIHAGWKYWMPGEPTAKIDRENLKWRYGELEDGEALFIFSSRRLRR